jgi:hypothetical protein
MNPFPTLPPRVSQEVLFQLFQALPPPPEDGPEARAERDAVAVAAVAAFAPHDRTEAMLAVQVVISDAFSHDCLRLANQYRGDIKKVLKARSQAAAMMREMQRALRALLARQARRPAKAPVSGPVAAPARGRPEAPRPGGNVVFLPVNRPRPATRSAPLGGASVISLFEATVRK